MPIALDEEIRNVWNNDARATVAFVGALAEPMASVCAFAGPFGCGHWAGSLCHGNRVGCTVASPVVSPVDLETGSILEQLSARWGPGRLGSELILGQPCDCAPSAQMIWNFSLCWKSFYSFGICADSVELHFSCARCPNNVIATLLC